MALPSVPNRIFSADVGQASTGNAGPDAIENDIDALKTSIQGVITALQSVVDGDSGADNVKITAISGVTGANVQSALKDLKTQINTIAQSGIADGSVSEEKLIDKAVTPIKLDREYALSYDFYKMLLPLYYTGHFSGPDTSGMKALTFDGFIDKTKIDVASTSIVNATDKAVYLGANTSATYDIARQLNGTTGYGTRLVYRVFQSSRGGILKMCGFRGMIPGSSNPVQTPFKFYRCDDVYGNNSVLLGSTTATIPIETGLIEADFSSLGIKVESGKYYKIEASVQFAPMGLQDYAYDYYVTSHNFNTSSDLITTSKKLLFFTPVLAKVFITIKRPGITDISPLISSNNGANYEAMTMISSKVDPLDTNMIEREYAVNFAYPGQDLKLKINSSTSTNQTTPEIIRYGIHLA